jgi:hypothetical protein
MAAVLNWTGVLTSRTVGDLVAEVRTMLGDPADSTGPSLSGTTTSRTVGEVITEARSLLNDTDPVPAYRYSDADLYRYFNNALLTVRRLRPDLFTRDTGLGLPAYGLDPSNDALMPFPLAEEVFPEFVYHVAGLAELRDDPTAAGERATTLLGHLPKSLEALPYRHSDEFLYGLLTDGIAELRRHRPDLFMRVLRKPLPVFRPADRAKPFPLAEEAFAPLAHYVVGSALSRDAAFTKESPAANHLILADMVRP